jgi:hypothetical protein
MWFLLSFPRVFRFSEVAGPEKAKNLAGQKALPPDSDPLTMPSLKENNLGLSREFLASTNCTSAIWFVMPSFFVGQKIGRGGSPNRPGAIEVNRPYLGGGTRVACKSQPTPAAAPPKKISKKSCHANGNCYKRRDSSSIGRNHAKI